MENFKKINGRYYNLLQVKTIDVYQYYETRIDVDADGYYSTLYEENGFAVYFDNKPVKQFAHKQDAIKFAKELLGR